MSGAAGLESIELPELPDLPTLEAMRKRADRLTKEEATREAEFEASPYLKDLLAKTEASKQTRKRALEDKYCRRGAAAGYGDCAVFEKKLGKDGELVLRDD